MNPPGAASKTPAPLTPPSRWVWGFGNLAMRVFYRVERLGHDLPAGALLLVANHPNTLVDPAVIQATAGRRIRFLGKSTLFEKHPLGPLIRLSGTIPVYRKMDAGVDTSRNVEMFAAVKAALAADEAICLFPEGLSHSSGRLEPLRTGAARMVLDSGANGHPVTIVPVGLNFDRVARFRSRATAVFGRPLDCADLEGLYATDEQAAVRQLTDRIEQRLRRLLVEAEPRQDLPMVARADRLYAAARGAPSDPRQRIERRRLIAEGMAVLRDEDPERLAAIVARIDDYHSRLGRFGLRDPDVDQRISFRAAARFTLREGLLALVLAPVALVSMAVFAPPYWFTGRLSRWAPDLQSRATWQVIGGALTYSVWIGGLAAVAGVRAGAPAGALALVGLTALAFGGMRAVEREAGILRAVRTFLALRQTPLRTRAGLRRERAALAEVLEEVRAWVERRTTT